MGVEAVEMIGFIVSVGTRLVSGDFVEAPACPAGLGCFGRFAHPVNTVDRITPKQSSFICEGDRLFHSCDIKSDFFSGQIHDFLP